MSNPNTTTTSAGPENWSDTEIRLMAVHRAVVIPINEVAERYLGLQPTRARVLASANALPFPTVRLTDSQKGFVGVTVRALAAHIDAVEAQATEQWERSRGEE